MKKIASAFARLARDERGSQATEIALGIVLIALVAGLGMVEFGAELRDFFTGVGDELEAASPGGVPAVPAAD